jgi:hypothetical protein
MLASHNKYGKNVFEIGNGFPPKFIQSEGEWWYDNRELMI